MKRLLHLSWLLACAACPGPSSDHATVVLHPQPTWSGTAEVLVHHADGSLVSRAPITDKLSVAIHDGDSVTIALHDGSLVELDTRLAVAPGDEIDAPAGPLSLELGSASVTLPEVAGATGWIVTTPQSAAETTALDQVDVQFPAGRSSIPVLGAAADATDTLALYGERSVPVAGSAPTIALTDALAWQPLTVTTTGIAEVVAGDVFVGSDDLAVYAPGLTTGDLPIPTSFGDQVGVVAEAEASDSISSAGVMLASRTTTTVTLDLTTPDLPTASALAVTSSGASWQLTGGGSYAALAVSLSSSTSTSTPAWGFVAPPGTTSLALPQLPADLAAGPFDSLTVAIAARSDIADYHDALAAFGPPADGTTWQEREVVSQPASARLRPGALVPSAALARRLSTPDERW
ncbi:MAG TPA: hypothetical protein VLX92_10390 [Kofleriaceae bacterium]|nr:hypothetical protein [Kofleriaceae bacterium]